jgi:chromosome segregation ATPase
MPLIRWKPLAVVGAAAVVLGAGGAVVDAQIDLGTPHRGPQVAAEELVAILSKTDDTFEALLSATNFYWLLDATRQQRDQLSLHLSDAQETMLALEMREKRLTGQIMDLREELAATRAAVGQAEKERDAARVRARMLRDEVIRLLSKLLTSVNERPESSSQTTQASGWIDPDRARPP